jgi:anaerobic glycerol-3-phosphate dehydrogenase
LARRFLIPTAYIIEQDVVIIGGGPGGYVAAIKAAQLGLKVRVALSQFLCWIFFSHLGYLDPIDNLH